MPNLRRALRFSSFRGAATHTQAVVVVTIAVVLAVSMVWYTAFAGSTPSPTTNPPQGSSVEWALLVDGFVQSSLNLTLDEIEAMPRSTVNSEIYCLPSPGSDGFLVEKGNWTGVRLGSILERTGVSTDAVKVAFYAEDGFITDLTLATALREDVILAYEKDGEPLREELRLVVPGNWGYKWIKWLTHIELMDCDFKGAYENAGFPDNAEILDK